MSIVSGNEQTGMVGKALRQPFVVKLTGATGRGLANRNVTFTVVSGGGSVSVSSATTDSEGNASTRLTLGWNVGINEVRASYLALIHRTRISITLTANGIEPITSIIPSRSTGPVPNIWNKFIGQSTNVNTPNLTDFSYAGCRNGEGIPEHFNLPIFNVTDYGAIPNDNRSDTNAIRSVLNAVSSGNAIVYFPPGQYDVLLDGEAANGFTVPGDNVIIRGSGAQGGDSGGTTIKMHNRLNVSDGWSSKLFKIKWHPYDKGNGTNIKGSFEKGSTFFDVEDTSNLTNTRFVTILARNLSGQDWDQHSSVSVDDMLDNWSIKDGIDIHEAHEVESIDGNRVHVKAPILTHLNSNFRVKWRKYAVGIGYEDLHIDCNFQKEYEHLVDSGYEALDLTAAHSWIRRCRVSNTTVAFWMGGYCNSVVSLIVDGNYGHYTGGMSVATYCFVGLVEDHTYRPQGQGDYGAVHGISVQNRSVGNVIWMIGGPTMKGPDTHGGQSRATLFDNYYGRTHDSSSGTLQSRPHHLDGYVRWNCYAATNENMDLWGGDLKVTQPIIVGYTTEGSPTPSNAYVRHFETRVFPNSLYETQLYRRIGLGYVWTQNAKELHHDFFASVFSYVSPENRPSTNRLPVFSNVENTQSVAEDTLPGMNIGSPYTATDAEQDTLVYSLENADASSFAIHSSTGQLKTDAILDYETKQTYTILVKVSDGNGGEDSIEVTI